MERGMTAVFGGDFHEKMFASVCMEAYLLVYQSPEVL